MPSGVEGVCKLIALVDLSRTDAGPVVENALGLAARLHADLTLLSVIPRGPYELGMRHEWPQNASGRAYPQLDVHRVMLPGSPAEALSNYADRIKADLLLVPAEYKVRRWLRSTPLAHTVAALTSRSLWVARCTGGASMGDAALRIGCVVRLDGTDERPCLVAQSIVHRRGGELVLVYATGRRTRQGVRPSFPVDRRAALDAMHGLGRTLDAPWSPLVIEDGSDAAVAAAAADRGFGLLVAGRPMYVNVGANSGDMLSLMERLPCPILSIPLSSVSSAACVTAPKSTATA